MKVSYNWLKEFVTIDLEPDLLAEKLTLSGAEVERVEKIRPLFAGVVVGRIVSVEPDEKEQNRTWCRVDIGSREITTLCAAPNTLKGLLTAVALPGVTLPGGYTVEAKKIEGRFSEAVLCSEKELDLSDNSSAILELPSTFTPGQELAEALKLEDYILDIDVTPNRPDLLSIRGVARDIAALTGRKLRKITLRLKEIGPPIEDNAAVTVRAYRLCPRYCARLIRGVAIKKSPFRIRRRLTLCGIKPVNNVVDATNYLLLELGQPLHAFDHERLAEGKIIVRRARPGERIMTIDGEERQLSSPMLVIADAEKPVAVAGVMGGISTEISDYTSMVLLESAYFDPISIRRTSRALGLSTEASRRFERGVDPRAVPLALDRASALILELAGGKIASGVIDKKRRAFKNISVSIRRSRTEQLLGYPLTSGEITYSLNGLGLETEKKGEDWLTFKIPSWRPDLTREVDLIEEVARLTGFDRIPAVMSVNRITYQPKTAEQKILDQIREILCGLGLDEVITYSFMETKSFDRLHIPLVHPLRRACEIANPVNKAQGLLRTTLIPGLLEIMERNMNQKADQVNIFELGNVFTERSRSKMPTERMFLSLALSRRSDTSDWCRPEPTLDFYTLKGILEILGKRLGGAEITFQPVDLPVFQSGQNARLMMGEKIVGIAGTVGGAILESYSLSAPVYLAELEVSPFLKAGSWTARFQNLDQYPSVRRDMALVVDKSVLYATIRKAIETHRPELLEEYILFDLYEGNPLPKGKKSFAFRLKYCSSYDTLCETTVNKMHRAFQEALVSALGCSFRE